MASGSKYSLNHQGGLTGFCGKIMIKAATNSKMLTGHWVAEIH